MTISIRSEATGGTTNGASGTFAVSKPADVQNGDTLLVIIGVQDNPTITSPYFNGWEILGSGGSTAGSDTYIGVFLKYVSETSGEPSAYTFRATTVNSQLGWWIGSLYSDDPTIHLDQAISFANRQNDVSPNTNALTTASDNVLAFAVWAVNNDNATTPPTGSWSVRADNVGGNGTLTVTSLAFASSGTSTSTPEITDVTATADTETAMILMRENAITETRVTHVGAYLEIEGKQLFVSHVGAYLEIEEVIPPSTSRRSYGFTF